jgi:hypothetical protein
LIPLIYARISSCVQVLAVNTAALADADKEGLRVMDARLRPIRPGQASCRLSKSRIHTHQYVLSALLHCTASSAPMHCHIRRHPRARELCSTKCSSHHCVRHHAPHPTSHQYMQMSVSNFSAKGTVHSLQRALLYALIHTALPPHPTPPPPHTHTHTHTRTCHSHAHRCLSAWRARFCVSTIF